MSAWNILLMTLSICASCRGRETEKLEFKKYGVVSSDMNILTCARQQTGGKACGCKKNIHIGTYEALWVAEWCKDRTTHPDYTYLLTKQRTYITPAMELSEFDQWLIVRKTPMCMDAGSTVSINFTLSTDWSRVKFRFENEHSHIPMVWIIYANDTRHEFISKNKCSSNCTFLFDNVQRFFVDGDLLMKGQNYVATIEILQTTYKVYINGKFFYEFEPMLTDITPRAVRINTKDVKLDFHYVQFIEADTI